MTDWFSFTRATRVIPSVGLSVRHMLALCEKAKRLNG